MYCHRDINELNRITDNRYYTKKLESNMRLAKMLEKVGITTSGENTELNAWIPLEKKPKNKKFSEWYRMYTPVQPCLEENGDIGFYFERFGFKICIPYNKIRKCLHVEGELVKYLKELSQKYDEIAKMAKNEAETILALEKLELSSLKTVNCVDK